jgi:hypothetical protein
MRFIDLNRTEEERCHGAYRKYMRKPVMFTNLLFAVVTFSSPPVGGRLAGEPPTVRTVEESRDVELAENAKKMADVARKIYDAWENEFASGVANIAELHEWSRKLMSAQIIANPGKPDELLARESHLKRMIKLQERIRGIDVLPASSRLESDYFVLEAQRMVMEAKKTTSKTSR